MLRAGLFVACCGTPAQLWIFYVHRGQLLLESLLLLTARAAPHSLSMYRPALLVLELMSLGPQIEQKRAAQWFLC